MHHSHDLKQPNSTDCSLLDLSNLDSIEQEWHDLIAECEDENPFFTPAFLQSALKSLATETPVKILCIRDTDRLIGLLPVVNVKGFAKAPFHYLKSWMHPYCYLGAPLIRDGNDAAFITAVHDGLSGLPNAPKLLRMERVPALSNLITCVDSVLADNSNLLSGEIQRSAIIGAFNYSDHLKTNITSRKRSDLSRLSRRLNEVGDVDFQLMSSNDDVDKWIDDFLTLENKGWKGKAGTSLAANANDKAFFIQMTRDMATQNRLVMQRMTVDSTIVAMSTNFLHNGQGYGFKACYDEDFSQYSPGVLASLNLMEYLGELKELRFFDSCMSPDKSSLQRFWPHKRGLKNLTICSDTIQGRLALLSYRHAQKASGFKTYLNSNVSEFRKRYKSV